MSKQTKITKSARGEECQVRIPGVCNFNTETTIFAHKGGGGMGAKSSDLHGAYCCSDCHDAVDWRRECAFSAKEVVSMFYEGIFRTQLMLIEKGLIELKTGVYRQH